MSLTGLILIYLDGREQTSLHSSRLGLQTRVVCLCYATQYANVRSWGSWEIAGANKPLVSTLLECWYTPLVSTRPRAISVEFLELGEVAQFTFIGCNKNKARDRIRSYRDMYNVKMNEIKLFHILGCNKTNTQKYFSLNSMTSNSRFSFILENIIVISQVLISFKIDHRLTFPMISRPFIVARELAAEVWSANSTKQYGSCPGYKHKQISC